jgi:hypothetical protein
MSQAGRRESKGRIYMPAIWVLRVSWLICGRVGVLQDSSEVAGIFCREMLGGLIWIELDQAGGGR